MRENPVDVQCLRLSCFTSESCLRKQVNTPPDGVFQKSRGNATCILNRRVVSRGCFQKQSCSKTEKEGNSEFRMQQGSPCSKNMLNYSFLTSNCSIRMQHTAAISPIHHHLSARNLDEFIMQSALVRVGFILNTCLFLKRRTIPLFSQMEILSSCI